MSSIPRFYVYVLARPNGKPFYVGKGSGDRIFAHDSEARRGHKCHKCNVIRKIWRQGEQYQRYTVFTTDNEQEAHDYERELIALYGRENLCNLTDGGEGASNPSPETIAKRIASQKKTFATPQSKAKRSEISKRAIRTPEWRANQSKGLKGRKLSPEQVEAMRQRQIGKKLPPHVVELQRQRMKGNKYGVGKGKKGRVIPEETRRKISVTLKEKAPWRGRSHTPESIEKMQAVKAWPYLVTLPSGEKIEVPHLRRFCEENGLNYHSMNSANNKGRSYRGYFAEPLERKHKVAKQRPRKRGTTP